MPPHSAILAALIGLGLAAMPPLPAYAVPVMHFMHDKSFPSQEKGEFSRPASEGPVLYFGTSGGAIVAYDGMARRTLWTYDNIEPVEGMPALAPDGPALYVGTADGQVLALNRKDGSLIWRQEIAGQNNARPLVAGDRLIIANSHQRLVALGREDGRWLWEHARTVVSRKTTVKGLPDPVLSGSNVVTGFPDAMLAAVTLESGDPVWSRRLSERHKFEDMDARPVFWAGLLWASSFEGTISGVNPADGEMVASATPGAHQSLAVVDGLVIAADPRPGRFAFRTDRPEEKVWDRTDSAYWHGFEPIAGCLAAATDDGFLVLMDPATGHVEDQYDFDVRFMMAPVAWEGGLALLSHRGTLLLVGVSGGCGQD